MSDITTQDHQTIQRYAQQDWEDIALTTKHRLLREQKIRIANPGLATFLAAAPAAASDLFWNTLHGPTQAIALLALVPSSMYMFMAFYPENTIVDLPVKKKLSRRKTKIDKAWKIKTHSYVNKQGQIVIDVMATQLFGARKLTSFLLDGDNQEEIAQRYLEIQHSCKAATEHNINQRLQQMQSQNIAVKGSTARLADVQKLLSDKDQSLQVKIQSNQQLLKSLKAVEKD